MIEDENVRNTCVTVKLLCEKEIVVKIRATSF